MASIFTSPSPGPSEGPAVFCLHGFPEGWMSWRPVMEALPQPRVFTPPTCAVMAAATGRTFGYDVFTLTDDIKALIEALNLEKPVLLSHDWGGALGWISRTASRNSSASSVCFTIARIRKHSCARCSISSTSKPSVFRGCRSL